MFERESRREKILEARNRELKLKLKTKSVAFIPTQLGEESELGEGETEEQLGEGELFLQDPMVVAATTEFHEVIDAETKVPEPEPDLEEKECKLLFFRCCQVIFKGNFRLADEAPEVEPLPPEEPVTPPTPAPSSEPDTPKKGKKGKKGKKK